MASAVKKPPTTAFMRVPVQAAWDSLMVHGKTIPHRNTEENKQALEVLRQPEKAKATPQFDSRKRTTKGSSLVLP